jgi:hypothetical protein
MIELSSGPLFLLGLASLRMESSGSKARRGAAWMWPKEGWSAQHGARERREVSLVEITTGVHRGAGGTWGGKHVSGHPVRPSKVASMGYVLGPVPGVDVMAKRSQGWVKCEDRLPYYRDSSCSLPLPRPHDYNSTTREDLAAGAGAPGAKGPLEWGS